MKEYTESGEWFETDDNVATVGISAKTLEEIGDVVAIDLPQKGKEIKKGEELFTIESIKSASSVHSPLSGKIVEVNKNIEDSPDIVNESPEEKGWIVKIRI